MDPAQTEDRFKILYESSSDAIMTLAPPDWKFTSGNPATIKLFDCKDEQEFTTFGPWDVSPKTQPDGTESSEKAKAMINKAMQEGSVLFEWVHKKISGQTFPANVRLTRVTVNGQQIVQATVRDMTEEKKNEETLRRYAAIVETTDDAIVSKDLNGVITTWNKGAEKMYLYTAEEIIGENITTILPDDRKDEVAKIMEKIIRGEVVNKYETKRLRKDGVVIDVELTVTPIKNAEGKIEEAAVIARDITAAKAERENTERLNKLMVNRELRMIELKNKLNQLHHET